MSRTPPVRDDDDPEPRGLNMDPKNKPAVTDDLSALALHVERGGDPLPLTLGVAGAIVTGTLVSRAVFLEEMQRFARTGKGPSLVHIEQPAVPSEASGAYVHLRDVEILVGAGPVQIEITTPGFRRGGILEPMSRLAKARVEDVQLWTLGHAKLILSKGLAELHGDTDEDRKPGARIMQVTPAGAGWRAVYEHLPERKRGDKTWTKPILCWALIHEQYDDEDGAGTTTYVAPIVPELTVNHRNGTHVGSWVGNFVGVAAPGEEPDSVLAANKYVEEVEAAGEGGGDRRAPSRAGKLLYLYAERAKVQPKLERS